MLPYFLKKGDKIAILSPSGAVSPDELTSAVASLKSWNLKPVLAPHCFARYGCFAGTPEQRLTDLQYFLNDADTKAILCSRGGYGLMQIIDKIDFEIFKQHPKWIVGYSDITVLHNALASFGIASIHAPMARNFSDIQPKSPLWLQYRDLLFGSDWEEKVLYHPMNRIGRTIGTVVGGNLSVFYGLRGTKYDVDLQGKIFFIEDIGEKPHHIDRMLRNLRLSGQLAKLAGLIVGQFSQCATDLSMMQNIDEIVLSAVSDYSYPVCFNFPSGHIKTNYPLPLGRKVFFDVSNDGATLRTLPE